MKRSSEDANAEVSLNEPIKPSKRSLFDNNLKLSARYSSHEFADSFPSQLRDCKPFPFALLEGFLEEQQHDSIEEIELELQHFEKWNRKENDLYSLYQTEDLSQLSELACPALTKFRKFLCDFVRPWLQNVTGVELTDQVDVTGSCYSSGDCLLPHNDLIGTRRFAFVYYLTDASWTEKNGGRLLLYNSDDDCQPTTVAEKFLPLRNSFMLFEVSQRSWHHIEEIVSETSPRLSINGWFHSKRVLNGIAPKPEVLSRESPIATDTWGLQDHISPTYREVGKLEKLREVFGDTSEALLTDFLNPGFYGRLLSAFRAETFQQVGPVNKRCLYRLETAHYDRINEFVSMLKTCGCAQYFETVTGCSLDGCEVNVSVNRVESGCYEVVGDEDAEQKAKDGYVLQVFFFFSAENDWNPDVGGSIVYVATDDEETVMQVTPKANSVAVVFKDPEVLPFIKYVTKKAEHPYFLVSLSYFNVKVSDSDDEDGISDEEPHEEGPGPEEVVDNDDEGALNHGENGVGTEEVSDSYDESYGDRHENEGSAECLANLEAGAALDERLAKGAPDDEQGGDGEAE